jgi:hypothetical protein
MRHAIRSRTSVNQPTSLGAIHFHSPLAHPQERRDPPLPGSVIGCARGDPRRRTSVLAAGTAGGPRRGSPHSKCRTPGGRSCDTDGWLRRAPSCPVSVSRGALGARGRPRRRSSHVSSGNRPAALIQSASRSSPRELFVRRACVARSRLRRLSRPGRSRRPRRWQERDGHARRIRRRRNSPRLGRTRVRP